MNSKMVIRILSISIALILSAMLCPTLTFGEVEVAEESSSDSLSLVDFGEVAVDSTSQETLVVTNINNEMITLRFSLSSGSNCEIKLLTESVFYDVGVDNSVKVTLQYKALAEYDPSAEEASSGSLYIVYTGQESNSTQYTILTLKGKGVAAEELKELSIDGRKTGVLDFQYEGKLFSVRLEEIAAKARNHGQYVWLVGFWTRRAYRDDKIDKHEMRAILKAAAHAKIPKDGVIKSRKEKHHGGRHAAWFGSHGGHHK
jgi:hypothetical protein